jgi:ABC-type Na+ efflux pump permease subunit
VLPVSARWANPITALAVSRRLRARAFIAWVLAAAFLAGGAGLAAYQWPEVVTPVLQRMLPGRLPSQMLPGRLPLMPGEIFLLGLGLGAFLVLTVTGTVPQAALAVARERERQTLESLLLTEMSPAAILWGKLVEVLLTPVLATVALLPLICLGFSLGGVSAGSLAATSAFLLVCHLLFGTASLAISSWCRRGGVAVVLAYLVVLWFCGGTLWTVFSWQRAGRPDPWWVDGIYALNPAAGLLDCVVPRPGVLVGSIEVPFAVVGSAVYALLSALCFALGIAGLRRH